MFLCVSNSHFGKVIPRSSIMLQLAPRMRPAWEVVSGPPPPPAVHISVACSDPSAEELEELDQILKVTEGKCLKVNYVAEKFGEVTGFNTNKYWIYVVRLGALEQEVGWAPRSLLMASSSIDVEMSSDEHPFHPFLGTWHQCYEKLVDISGIWRDNRKHKPKTYKVSTSEEGYANVLTELPWGGCRRGPKLLTIRKVGNKFVLDKEAGKTKLQWIPINDQLYTAWPWERA